MKIRNGFVSNSSSSSYILATKREQKCECCGLSNSKMIELASLMLGKKEFDGCVPKSFNGNVSEYVESLDDEIENLKKDILWATEKIEILQKISKNNDAITLMDQWNVCENLRNDRYNDESEYRSNPTENLKWNIERLGNDISGAKNKIAEIKTKKQKLLTAIDENRKIFIFEMDNWSRAREIVRELIENDTVEIIEEIHT